MEQLSSRRWSPSLPSQSSGSYLVRMNAHVSRPVCLGKISPVVPSSARGRCLPMLRWNLPRRCKRSRQPPVWIPSPPCFRGSGARTKDRQSPFKYNYTPPGFMLLLLSRRLLWMQVSNPRLPGGGNRNLPFYSSTSSFSSLLLMPLRLLCHHPPDSAALNVPRM